eukprot:COSAG03_NODE_13783_length_488_cov_2.172237_1_plen_50_part_10
MGGGYKSTAGGNHNMNCTSWQDAVVSGQGGGPNKNCPGGTPHTHTHPTNT